MDPEIRVIHWYDTEHHRIACGAPGQSNSTKHRRGVTCSACLTRVAVVHGTTNLREIGGKWVH